MEVPNSSKYDHLRLEASPPLQTLTSSAKRRSRYLVCSILIVFFVLINLWATKTSPKVNVGEFKDTKLNKLQLVDLTGCDGDSEFKPDIDSKIVFPNLNFNLTPHTTPSDSDIPIRYWWNTTIYNFEERYLSKFHNPLNPASPPPLVRVFVVPHSHNDPGWLYTFQEYFSDVKMILDNVVSKLSNYTDMTFVQREVCFLDLWWNQATPEQRAQFKSLTKEGRLEILAGGWTMPDEATVDLYTMIQQMVEGNQWVKSHLGEEALGKVGWSIDPFGQGSLMPYLLEKSGVERMVVGRLHYGWKLYLAEKQWEDFNWVQRWDQAGEMGTLCHSLEYDSYVTRNTCGPETEICENYDFYTINNDPYYAQLHNGTSLWEMQNNLPHLATMLVQQLQRTASLGNSNVVLFPLGNDFSFADTLEWDQQYGNYTRLFSYINEHKDDFGMEIGWGTVSSFFDALEQARSENYLNFPTFSGDFFPYADVYVSGNPAYWTGFYSTRPYWKKFHREVAAELRSAQILYTFTAQLAKGGVFEDILRVNYKNLLKSRRNFALFSHHDGVTGTSRASTMQDYGDRLLSSYEISHNIQAICIRTIISTQMEIHGPSFTSNFNGEWEYGRFGLLAEQKERLIYDKGETSLTRKVVLFNSLSFKREEVVTLRITGWPIKQYVEVKMGSDSVKTQINPVVALQNGHLLISKDSFDLTFPAVMQPLSINIYNVRGTSQESGDEIAKISCRGCHHHDGANGGFDVTQFNENYPFSLQSDEQLVKFNPSSGLPSHISKTNAGSGMSLPLSVSLGCYVSNTWKGVSGAYILQVEGENSDFTCLLNQTLSPPLLKVEGPLTSSVTVFNPPFTIKTTIHRHLKEKHIHMESLLDSGTAFGEYYMRIDTEIDNSATAYTDQGGFTMEKRVRLDELGYEANHYPITTMTYIQEKSKGLRVSLGVNRPHGYALSETPGRLEVMVERRTFYDDSRGMGEPVKDNKPTISEYVIIIEYLKEILTSDDDQGYKNNLLTLNAQQVSLSINYPLNQFGFDYEDDGDISGENSSFSLIKGKGLSPHTHLISLTTLPAKNGLQDELNEIMQEGTALMIVQRFGVLLEGCSGVNASINLFQDGMGFNLKSGGVKQVSTVDLAGVGKREETFPDFESIQGKMFEIFSLLVEFGN